MTDITAIRDSLKRAAAREPERTQNMLATIDKQLKGYAKGDADDKSALRPQIEASIRRIEKARAL